MAQKHLKYVQVVNSGSYYTPDRYIEVCYKFLIDNINQLKNYYILDSACGYGHFFKKNIFNHKKYLGADIDKKAINLAREKNANAKYFIANSLLNVDRKKYSLTKKDKLIIIGNPPYNDSTSIIKNRLKKDQVEIDEDIKTRDLGISFLKSYAKLDADYICVLHPLSYLIKESNFKLLKSMTDKYVLSKSIVFDSKEFSETSKETGFPIIIAFYEKDKNGINYEFIKNHTFETIEGRKFKISDYDYIDNYLSKYPTKKPNNQDTIAHFWTMRDINALKRNRTFIKEKSYNTIDVTHNNIDYYCYVDVFKKHLSHVPYYFGNSNVMIDKKSYMKIKDDITKYAIINNNVLNNIKSKLSFSNTNNIDKGKINQYFKKLLGEHYV